ncbi:hypothetical protein JL720_5634 [Aureococcus anophagefferens]|nr:hypothetical protein JL720_5634 [Aureococcus anophagefferens]
MSMETPSQEALLLIADYLERCTPCAGAAPRREVAAHEPRAETRGRSEVPVSVASRLRDFPLGLKEGLLEERLVTGLAAEAKPAEREAPDESGGRALGDGTVVFSAPPPRSLLFEPNRAEAEAKRQADILDARDRLIRDCRALRDADAPPGPGPRGRGGGGRGAGDAPADQRHGRRAADARASAPAARTPGRRALEKREELLRREAERNALLAKKADLAELVERDKAAARDPHPRSSSAFFPVRASRSAPAAAARGLGELAAIIGPQRGEPAREQRLGRRASLSGHQNFAVYSVAFDASGDFVVTGADDYLAKVWHAPSATLCHTLRGHKGVISDVAVSPCNLLVASASDDGTCRLHPGQDKGDSTLHRLRDGAPVAVLTLTGDCGTAAAPLPPVEAIAFDDATGRLLATGQKHCDARAWDAAALLQGCEDRAWTADGGAWDALVVGAVLPHAPRTRLRGLGARGGLAATGGDDAGCRQAPGPGCALARACADAELACAAARRRRADDGGDARTAASDADRGQRARRRCAPAPTRSRSSRGGTAPRRRTSPSKAGDRLLSASVKACAATVWSWRDVARTDGGRSVDACGVDLNVRSGDEAPRELSAACWTCDDALIPAGDDRAKGLARVAGPARGLEGPAADAAAADAGARGARRARWSRTRADLFHSGPPLAKFQATRHWWPRARDVPERDEPRAPRRRAPGAASARARRRAGAGGNDGVAYEHDDDDDDDGDDDDDDDGLGSGDSDVANGRRGLRRLRRGNDAGDDSDDFEGRLLRSRRAGGRRLAPAAPR